MLHTHHTDSGTTPVVITKNKEGQKLLRQSGKKGDKPFGRTTFGKRGSQNEGGIVTAYVPGGLFRQIVAATKVSGRSISDLVRAGLIREVGAVAMAAELKLPLAKFNLGPEGVDPVASKPTKPAKAKKADKDSVVISRKELNDIEKSLRRSIKFIKNK